MILKNDLLVLPFLGLWEKQCFLYDTKCKIGSCSVFYMCTHWLGVASLVHVQVCKGRCSYLLYGYLSISVCIRETCWWECLWL